MSSHAGNTDKKTDGAENVGSSSNLYFRVGIGSKNVGRVKLFLYRNLQDFKSCKFWVAVSAEFLGTLFLCVWVIGSSLHHIDEPAPPQVNVALCYGFTMAVLMTSLANVSGGHVNPALSAGYFVTGQITLVRFVLYVIAQSSSCIAALMGMSYVVPVEMLQTMGMFPGKDVTPLMAFTCEFLMAFLLLFGTMAMLDSKRTDVKGSVPLFVGLIFASNYLFGGRISGGAMNPVLSIYPALVSVHTDLQWVYWLGPLLGAVIGALAYDKGFSVTAASKPLCPCRKSRGSDVTEKVDEEEISLHEVRLESRGSDVTEKVDEEEISLHEVRLESKKNNPTLGRSAAVDMS